MARFADLTSVVICYQAGSELRNALDSINEQTLKSAKVLVVDDGSTDCFCQHLKESGKLKIMRVSHGGQNRALNLALKHVITKYVAFLDDDDEWFPSKTGRQVTLFESNPSLRVVFGAVRNVWCRPDSLDLHKDFPPSRVLGATMFQRDVFELVGAFPDDQTMHGVISWWSKAAHFSVPTLAHSDLVLKRRIDGFNEGIRRVAQQRVDLISRLRLHVQEGRAS